MGVSDDVLEVLAQYPFPGNVRELENIIERAVALSDESAITLGDLPSDLRDLSMSTLQTRRMVSLAIKEKEYIEEVLRRTNNNKVLAAEILEVSRTTLWRKMKRYGIDG
jgi:transcriptional regulator with PAS, ATPase and Fis domain